MNKITFDVMWFVNLSYRAYVADRGDYWVAVVKAYVGCSIQNRMYTSPSSLLNVFVVAILLVFVLVILYVINSLQNRMHEFCFC